MAMPENTPGRDMTITPLRTERALVLTLSGTVDATLASTLAGEPHAARTLVEFAHARTDRGTRCVLLTAPGSDAVRTALDAADPRCTVPRTTSLEQALAEPPDDEAPGTAPVVEMAGTEAAEQFLSD